MRYYLVNTPDFDNPCSIMIDSYNNTLLNSTIEVPAYRDAYMQIVGFAQVMADLSVSVMSLAFAFG